jgi:hypothetical protein
MRAFRQSAIGGLTVEMAVSQKDCLRGIAITLTTELLV